MLVAGILPYSFMLVEETIRPKQTYIGHPEIFFNEMKHDVHWKRCSGRNGIGLTTHKLSYMVEPDHMVAPFSIK